MKRFLFATLVLLILSPQKLRAEDRLSGEPQIVVVDSRQKWYVDYDVSVETMLGRGRYVWNEPHITSKNFPSRRKGKSQIVPKVAWMTGPMTTAQILQKFDILNLRPAETHELLLLGEYYPHAQEQRPIIALDSVWQWDDKGAYVPCLMTDDEGRGVGLCPFNTGWAAGTGFLVVDK